MPVAWHTAIELNVMHLIVQCSGGSPLTASPEMLSMLSPSLKAVGLRTVRMGSPVSVRSEFRKQCFLYTVFTYNEQTCRIPVPLPG